LTISIHQPNFFPWLGYLDKMSKSDVFVILDTVQYEKDSYTNRTKIKGPNGEQWLTMSIKNNFPQIIKDVEFANYRKDRDRILKTIELNYKRAPGFNTIFPILQELMKDDWEKLSGFNIHIIKNLIKGHHNQPRIEIASEYDFKGQSTELLVNICKYFGGDIYLSGCGAKNYQEEEMFRKAKIDLEYNEFKHPIYNQLWGEFIPCLSIIDSLMNQKYGS